MTRASTLLVVATGVLITITLAQNGSFVWRSAWADPPELYECVEESTQFTPSECYQGVDFCVTTSGCVQLYNEVCLFGEGGCETGGCSVGKFSEVGALGWCSGPQQSGYPPPSCTACKRVCAVGMAWTGGPSTCVDETTCAVWNLQQNRCTP